MAVRNGDTPDLRLQRMAERHGGAFTRSLARKAGFSPREIDRRLLSGEWIVLHREVYCSGLLRNDRDTRLHGALLYAGAKSMLSHITAARLLGLDVPGTQSILWVTVPHNWGRYPDPSVVVTRTRNLPAPVWVAGKPITPPARTIVDLAQTLDEESLLPVLHHAVRRRVVPLAQVLAAAEGRGGCEGITLVREVARRFDPAYESMAEVQAGRLFHNAGLEFSLQTEVRDQRGRYIAQPDFADEARKIAIFVDGLAFHSDPAAQENDRRQDRWLRRLGWDPMRFTADEVFFAGDNVVAEIFAAISNVDRHAA